MREPEWGKLYELVQTVAADMPMPGQFTPAQFDQWAVLRNEKPNLLSDAYMIARKGSQYVGLAVLPGRSLEVETNRVV